MLVCILRLIFVVHVLYFFVIDTIVKASLTI